MFRLQRGLELGNGFVNIVFEIPQVGFLEVFILDSSMTASRVCERCQVLKRASKFNNNQNKRTFKNSFSRSVDCPFEPFAVRR